MHELLRNQIAPYRFFPTEVREAPRSVREVNPRDLPALRWYNSDRARKIIDTIAFLSVLFCVCGTIVAVGYGIGSLGFGIYSAISGSIWVSKSVCITSLVATISLVAIGVLSGCIGVKVSSYAGPDVRIRARTNIIDDLKNNNYGLKDILRRFQHERLYLIRPQYGYTREFSAPWESIFTKEDTTLLLDHDLRTLRYEEFMEKHGQEALQHLTRTGIAKLSIMFIERSNMRISDITKEPYNTIRIELSTSPKSIQKKIIASKLGLVEFKRANFRSVLPETLYEETYKTLLKQQLERLAQDNNYLTFKELNGIDCIEKSTSEQKKLLCAAFLQLPHNEQISALTERDRLLLGLDTSIINTTHTKKLEARPGKLLAELANTPLLGISSDLVSRLLLEIENRKIDPNKWIQERQYELQSMSLNQIVRHLKPLIEKGVIPLQTLQLRLEKELESQTTLETALNFYEPSVFSCGIFSNSAYIKVLARDFIKRNARSVVTRSTKEMANNGRYTFKKCYEAVNNYSLITPQELKYIIESQNAYATLVRNVQIAQHSIEEDHQNARTKNYLQKSSITLTAFRDNVTAINSELAKKLAELNGQKEEKVNLIIGNLISAFA